MLPPAKSPCQQIIKAGPQPLSRVAAAAGPKPTSCACRCGRILDRLSHFRAAFAGAGVLGEVDALESVATRVCRGGSWVQDLDLAAPDALTFWRTAFHCTMRPRSP